MIHAIGNTDDNVIPYVPKRAFFALRLYHFNICKNWTELYEGDSDYAPHCAGSHSSNKMSDVALCLLPYLWARGQVMG